MTKHNSSPVVIDLFCGVGGLTHGFVKEGVKVVAGFDIDETCRFAYEKNNTGTAFFCEDVAKVTGEKLLALYPTGATKILVGCAPCQPFSSYNFKNEDTKKWFLLHEFARLIAEVQPEIISMENVPQLINFKKAHILEDFLAILTANGYHYSHKIVDCPKYGLPQNRKRLVLLASKFGKIELLPETHKEQNFVTVKQVLQSLPPLAHGEQHAQDPLHRAAKLTPLNLQRIRQSKPGGSWRDWDESIRLKCHQKESGQTYVSVYGRMTWDAPSPTITTQCYGLGNGRFGHPEQDRALSLREAALLQSFPADYQFLSPSQTLPTRVLGTHIGNAVPVLLGQIIAKSIKQHLQDYGKGN